MRAASFKRLLGSRRRDLWLPMALLLRFVEVRDSNATPILEHLAITIQKTKVRPVPCKSDEAIRLPFDHDVRVGICWTLDLQGPLSSSRHAVFIGPGLHAERDRALIPIFEKDLLQRT